jgi:hypothetical protein
MKSSESRWAKLIGVVAFGAMFLSIGTGPVAAVTTCKPGYMQVSTRLCITPSPQSTIGFGFDHALANCRRRGGRVATYGDLYYLYYYTDLDASFNPNGKWLGPDLIGDDWALCGNADVTYDNDPDINNFEGTCNKHDWWRDYWCAHDLD